VLNQNIASASLPCIAQKPRNRSSFGQVAKVTVVVLWAFSSAFIASASDKQRQHVINVVNQIKRADYEGDRAALQRLYGELAPFVNKEQPGARVAYWRGFAMWRRAINGFNDKVSAEELKADLRKAVDEFRDASAKDPNFIDAKIGELSCLGFLAFGTGEKNSAEQQEYMTKGRALWKEVQAIAPDNPRLLWVVGPSYWNSPPERGGQAKAIELYQKGLETIRTQKDGKHDALDPTWGEPELLMSLAWSNLNRATPDLSAAEQYANTALKHVPYWHYVRDILLPQILAAKKKLI
jgi:hypothetical protein